MIVQQFQAPKSFSYFFVCRLSLVLSRLQAISRWGINYVVLTSVDRDDLEDGGANHFGRTVELIKAAKPDMLVECLVSDFRGDMTAVDVSRESARPRPCYLCCCPR